MTSFNCQRARQSPRSSAHTESLPCSTTRCVDGRLHFCMVLGCCCSGTGPSLILLPYGLPEVRVVFLLACCRTKCRGMKRRSKRLRSGLQRSVTVRLLLMDCDASTMCPCGLCDCGAPALGTPETAILSAAAWCIIRGRCHKFESTEKAYSRCVCCSI